LIKNILTPPASGERIWGIKMRVEQIGSCTLYLGKMEDTIGGIEHVDHILTDPPYLYIKTHDFDKAWNEQLFFENVKRLLSDDGFIALFGRGTSFYRWNSSLADMKFIFKEEIIWDKRYTSAPCIALSRVHENISLHTKKTGKIRHSKVPYVEQKQYNVEVIARDIASIKRTIRTDDGLISALNCLKTGLSKIIYKTPQKIAITNRTGFSTNNRSDFYLRSIIQGTKEKSIISVPGVKVGMLHPTEKPVRLAERILALISDPGDTIYDPFMGSGSFGVACINTGRKYIGSEMKSEYFDIACKRIKETIIP
jgi:site-specific DNA-methyltransferase (adenine-specific)